MRINEKEFAELMESVARRTVESIMLLYKEETRHLQRVFFSDGSAEIKYNEKSQSIDITRPDKER
jgi:hypothetical protein